MRDSRLAYRVHKWLAVVVVAATLAWFTSGVVMVLPARWLTLSPNLITGIDAEARLPGAPGFDEARITPSEAIAVVRERLPGSVPVTKVRLRRFPGHVAYEVTVERRGTFLIDAISGVPFRVDEKLAREIVARFLGSDAGLAPVGERDSSNPTLQRHRIVVSDGKGTGFDVDAATGEVESTDRLKRAAYFVMGLHRFAPLRALFPEPVARVLMLAMASTGVLMTLAGMVIMIGQVQRWWRRPPVHDAR